jgi:hypothetical protein
MQGNSTTVATGTRVTADRHKWHGVRPAGTTTATNACRQNTLGEITSSVDIAAIVHRDRTTIATGTAVITCENRQSTTT